jgi:hypothetical protein
MLRHPHTGKTDAYLMGLHPPLENTKQDVAALEQWEEDAADYGARTWGFPREFDTFLQAYREARRPRWLSWPKTPSRERSECHACS